jgi:perosamine synthetase
MHCAKANTVNTPSIDLFCPVHLPEMEAAVLGVMRSGQIASGPKVSEFEEAFGAIVGREHIVSTNDLTSAVTLALHLAGVSAGDEVATLAFSCLQSNSPIASIGARPVWIDINPATMSMSVEDLAVKLMPSVKAVMVYHVAGYHADTNRIANLCKERGIPLIEDCNNAIGASLNGQPAGVLGDYAVYSLYPNRQINGIDGGLLATPDAETAARAVRLRRFGIDSKSFRDIRGEINPVSDVTEIGWSFSLNHLNAAVALAQLNSLNERILRTREITAQLIEALNQLHDVNIIQNISGAVSAYWGLLVQSEHRNTLLAYLKRNGVKSSILHQRNDWYSGFGVPRADLPGTETVMNKVLALPCGWWLNNEQVNQLIRLISDFKVNGDSLII